VFIYAQGKEDDTLRYGIIVNTICLEMKTFQKLTTERYMLEAPGAMG
jgi:hypothetical protein